MIATVVVAHVDRIEQAHELRDNLGALVTLDDGTLGAGGNHREALRLGLATGAEHVLVLEDDALPIDGLLDHVAHATKHRPDQLLGLYVGQQRPRAERVAEAVRKADEQGASWLTYPGLLWGVATVWPADLARDYLRSEHSSNLWDVHVKRWCQRRGLEVAYCWPSLVDHRDEDSVVVRQAGRQPGRVAWRVGVPSWSDVSVAI